MEPAVCFSVYLGCHEQLPINDVPCGSLSFQVAEWRPPAISEFPFAYYLGRQGEGGQLECSCLLLQDVGWNESGPYLCPNGLASEAPSCPFEDLRSIVESAQRSGKPVVMVCDDSGGVELQCSNEDYDHLLADVEMISSDSYMFADPISSFPWRVFHFVSPQGTGR